MSKDEWSSGLKIYKELPIIVPIEACEKMLQLSEYAEGREYGIIGIVEDNYLKPESIMIPPQEVSAASINFDDGIDHDKYNFVCHRHPDGCNSFSGTDWKYINANFDYSLVWTIKDGFVDKIARKKIEGDYYFLPLNIIPLDRPQDKALELPEGVKLAYKKNGNFRFVYEGLKEEYEKNVRVYKYVSPITRTDKFSGWSKDKVWNYKLNSYVYPIYADCQSWEDVKKTNEGFSKKKAKSVPVGAEELKEEITYTPSGGKIITYH